MRAEPYFRTSGKLIDMRGISVARFAGMALVCLLFTIGRALAAPGNLIFDIGVALFRRLDTEDR